MDEGVIQSPQEAVQAVEKMKVGWCGESIGQLKSNQQPKAHRINLFLFNPFHFCRLSQPGFMSDIA